MNTAVTEQASAPSVEERAAAALFGSPKPKVAPAAPPAPVATEDPEQVEAPNAEQTDDQPDAATEAPTAEETFEFEQEGTRWALPKALEKAVMHEKDYTQKSQEVANQRRMYEALNEQAKVANLTREFEASTKAEFQQLSAYDSVLSAPLSQGTPEEMSRELANRYQWQRERDALARSINEKHQAYSQNFEKAVADLRTKSVEAVSKKIPGWSDALWTSVRDHAKSGGYTDTELNAISDPRHMETLWKAQQYDALKSKATKTVADVKTVRTTPSNPMPQAVKEKLAFNKALAKATDPNQRKNIVEAQVGRLFAKR